VRSLDPRRRVAILADDEEMPFDLFLGVPVHQVPAVVAQSGMCVDGWIPVNPLTLETGYPDVYGRRRHQRRHTQGGRLLRAAGLCGRRAADRQARPVRGGSDL
jgi:hypothetical protein